MKLDYIFSRILLDMRNEISEELLSTEDFKLVRIVSSVQATPEGGWYDQDTNEGVILLSGSAGLLFDGEEEIFIMGPGDYVHIPSHRRHRVGWTDAKQKTVQLAHHYA